MKHFLAYGHADQASFRTEEVRSSFDVLTVPATIAAYYADATAAFVITSQLDYIIEPRTPLFQNFIATPRASHYALAAVLGTAMANRMGTHGPASFPVEFYEDHICEEIVGNFVNFQREYGRGESPDAQKRNRYAKLMEEALGTPAPLLVREERAPSYVLCPYFAVESQDDPWWLVNWKLWRATESLSPENISPVLAVRDVRLLGRLLSGAPDHMSRDVFYWVAGFDERKETIAGLVALRNAIREQSASRHLINLYGGFFSICMGYVGLRGFNNGLGYSEYRDWPDLAATGAGPPRYYVPRLHAYLSQRTAALLLAVDPSFACYCQACEGAPDAPVRLRYHSLKLHFALARKEELRLCRTESPADVAARLQDAYHAADRARFRLPSRLHFPYQHLDRWARVIQM